MVRDGEDATGVWVTSAADVFAEADGTVIFRFHERSRLDAVNTAELIRAHVAAAAGAKRPVLVDLRGLAWADREARAMGAGKEPTSATSCMALLVGNPVTRFLGNFFLSVTRPVFPTRIFTNEDEARAWLRHVR